MRVDFDDGTASMIFCQKCNVEVKRDMEHCDDCQVCFTGHDHHCVFFSKCIASGNIYAFYITIGMLIANMAINAILTMIYGRLEDFINI